MGPGAVRLTALRALPDRVDGFPSGADAYLAKPFAMEERVVRVGSLARRAAHRLPVHLAHADVEMDEARREVRRGGVQLTQRDDTVHEEVSDARGEPAYLLGRPFHHDESQGIGLSLVAEIAAAHGGGLAADARPGGGAVTRLALGPRAACPGRRAGPRKQPAS